MCCCHILPSWHQVKEIAWNTTQSFQNGVDVYEEFLFQENFSLHGFGT
jgi:hypothetical protein